MIGPALVLLNLLGVSIAQSSVSLFLPGFDSQPLQATIVGTVCIIHVVSLPRASRITG
jgi:hypothetical protein